MDLVIFGPPGAGKGTQAKRLEGLLGVPQISTGDMMRTERASGSELGKRFDSFMTQGLLVPDELVANLIEKRLGEPDAKNGAIFDGYPRTVNQAEVLDGTLAKLHRQVGVVVSIEVGLEDLVDRIVGRRVCEACGQVYHLRYNPPPSSGRCGACDADSLIQRTDDTEDKVRTRYDEYKAKTEPLLHYYGRRNLVRAVSGVGSLDEVTQRIEAAIGK